MDRDEAIAAKALLLNDLAEGYLPGQEDDGPRISWSDFRFRYEIEHLATLSRRYQESWRTSANHVERLIVPERLSDLDKTTLSKLRGELLAEGKSTASVKSYITTVKAALSWACDLDLLDEVPRLRRMKSSSKSSLMRSRPTSEEEFEKFLMTIPKVRPHDHEQWEFFCRGLRLGGFRIDELRRLSWDRSEHLSIDTSHEIPLIRMLAEGHKSRRDVYQPMTKSFWDLINRPGQPRSGSVFPIKGQRGLLKSNSIGRVITAIGRRAGIVTGEGENPKTATSNDIGRRMFITGVAKSEGLSVAQKWARHKNSETTEKYYVSHAAIELAKDAGW